MSRKIEVAALPLTLENEFLVVEVSYDEGGENYFSGNRSRRGYYLVVRQEKREGRTRSFMMFNGRRMLLEEASRFSQRRLEFVAETVKIPQERYRQVICEVLKENKIELAESVNHGSQIGATHE